METKTKLTAMVLMFKDIRIKVMATSENIMNRTFCHGLVFL